MPANAQLAGGAAVQVGVSPALPRGGVVSTSDRYGLRRRSLPFLWPSDRPHGSAVGAAPPTTLHRLPHCTADRATPEDGTVVSCSHRRMAD